MTVLPFTLDYLCIAPIGESETRGEGWLTERGGAQMRNLGNALRPMLEAAAYPKVLCSTARWEYESAMALAEGFGGGVVERFPYANYFRGAPQAEIARMVEEHSERTDALIVVASVVLVPSYARYFTYYKFAEHREFSAVKHGEGYLLDIQNRKWLHVPTGGIVETLPKRNFALLRESAADSPPAPPLRLAASDGRVLR